MLMQNMTRLQRALLVSQVFAFLWWLAALGMRELGVFVWLDQEGIFRASVTEIADPYVLIGFVHPVWVPFFVAPFWFLPLEMGALAQTSIYFAAITGVIFKFEGDMRAVWVTLGSYTALDAVIQMNIDWVVVLGLLVPVWASAPLVFAKPQLAVGYYFGLKPKQWLVAGAVGAFFVGLTFLIWGFWPLQILEVVGERSIGRDFNVAPMNLMPRLLSIAIGVGMAIWAFRLQDPAIGILAWLFFTPYIAPYSLLLPLAMVAVRFFRLALIITIAMWVIYGGFAAYALVRVNLLM